MPELIAGLLQPSGACTLVQIASARCVFGNTEATIEQPGELHACTELLRVASVRQ